MNTEDRLVDLKFVMARIGVSRATVYSWIAKGIMPKPKKLGTLTRWNLSELLEWEAARPRLHGD